MAYRRTTTARRTTRRVSRRASYSAAPRRRAASTARRRAPARSNTGRSGRAQTVRIVVEGLPASPVARRNPFERVMGLTPQVEQRSPKKAKL